MALQVINDPYRNLMGGLGASAGAGLSKGLQSHLDELAQERLLNIQNKISETKSRQQAEALRPILKQSGQPDWMADLLAVNPQLGIQFLKGEQQRALSQDEGKLFDYLMNFGSQNSTNQPALGQQPQGVIGNKTPPPALKPGKALPTAQFFKGLEQNKVTNDLKRQQLQQSSEQFEKTFQSKQEKEKTDRDLKKIETEKKHSEKYLAPKKKAYAHAHELEDILNEYENLLTKEKALAGPVFGRLGAFTQNTSRLNQLAQQILTHELLSAQGGGRGSDLLRKVIQGGKISPNQPVGTQLTYIKKAKEAVKKLMQEENIVDKIIEEKGYAPANIESLVKKELKKTEKVIKKGPDISELPDPKTYKGNGFIDEETGSKINVVDGEWEFV